MVKSVGTVGLSLQSIIRIIDIHPIYAESTVDLAKTDLNLLVYLDVLLRERSVTRAAQQLGISQPAMSNGLRRLRTAFDDPLLVAHQRRHGAY